MTKVEIPYIPRKAQYEIHKNLKRFNVLVLHRRAGKTVLCINQLIIEALRCKKDRARLAYIAPLYKQAKSVSWDYLKHYTSVIPGVKYNESELRVDFPNGARISLYGADNYDALRGIYLDGVVLDEYAQMPSKAWTEVLRPALADRKGWAVFIGTPMGHNAFHDLYRYAQESDDWYTTMLKASESGILEQEELDDAKRIMDEDEYLQEFECSFTAAVKGSYYGKHMQEARDNGRICGVNWEKTIPVYTAWDLGFDDATAIIFYQVVGKEIHIIDAEEHNGEDLEFYVNLLDSKPYKYEMHYLPHDAGAKSRQTGLTDQEILADLGLYNTEIVPIASIQAGINKVRKLFPKFYINNNGDDEMKERMGYFIDCISQYRKDYDEKRQIFRSKPLHDFCFVAGTLVSTPNGDVPIENLKVGDLVKTPGGTRKILNTLSRSVNETIELKFSNSSALRCTPNHKIYTKNGMVTADALRYSDCCYTIDSKCIMKKALSLREKDIRGETSPGAITSVMINGKSLGNTYTLTYGALKMERSQKTGTFTILTEIHGTIALITFRACQQANIWLCMAGKTLKKIRKNICKHLIKQDQNQRNGIRQSKGKGIIAESVKCLLPKGVRKTRIFGLIHLKRLEKKQRNGMQVKREESGIANTGKKHGKRESQYVENALYAIVSFIQNAITKNTAARIVSKKHMHESVRVYDLTIDFEHCFYANGILVSNCSHYSDALRILASSFVPPDDEPDEGDSGDISGGVLG